MFYRIHKIFLLLTILRIYSLLSVYGQEAADSVISVDDTTGIEFIADSIATDTLVSDTTVATGQNKPIDFPVFYDAADSMITSLEGDTTYIYLYGKGIVKYDDIELTADYIEFDMTTREVYATGMPDSVGKMAGEPVFKQGGEEFQSKKLRYNFETRKGYINEIKTQQQEGFLHSRVTKRHPNGHIHLKDGKYTTCDAEHPHFYVGLTKAIAVPNDKIVSGPAYLVIEDIPLPLVLPFGFFPNTKAEATKGILMPVYGEETNRGFFLKNGGFYWPINEYMDLKLTGDIYSRGTWGLQMATTYRKRYKFSGSVNGRYYQNVSNPNEINPSKSTDISIQWSHRQDPKANPNSNFSASVNYSTRSFDQNHSLNIQERLTNTKTSSISYQKIWPNSPFNFSTTLNHSQNSRTKTVNMTVPNINFSMNQIYPFRGKNMTGKPKWYQNIRLGYSSEMRNEIQTYDTLLFTSTQFEDFDNGYRHSIPLSLNFKLLKLLNLTPNVSYTGMIYTNKVKKVYDPNAISSRGDTGIVVSSNVPGFYYAHAWKPSAGTSVNPKVYGFYTFREDSRVQAIRHMISPTIGFSFSPNMEGLVPDYYEPIRNSETGEIYKNVNGVEQYYSIFEDEIYGTPTARGKSGSVSLGLNNNLEMKIFPKNDTVDEPEKVTLLDNMNFSTGYNLFAEEFKWRPVSMNARTTLFNRKLSINANGSLDPYGTDTINGRLQRINEFAISKNNKLFRLTRFGVSMNISFRSEAGGEDEEDPQETTNISNAGLPVDEFGNPVGDMFGYNYVDFSVPWSISAAYSFNYSKPLDRKTLTQTLSLNGDFSLTPKWKISYRTGYDFQRKEFSLTSFRIHRDLHCWEMSLHLIPFGPNKSYHFTINVKSTILKDLKFDKKSSPWDRYN